MNRIKYASTEERQRVTKLARGISKSLHELNATGTSKREARAEHNAKLQAKAIAEGRDPKKLRYDASPGIHSFGTMDGYCKDCERALRWVTKRHPEVTTIRFAYKKGYLREYIQDCIDRGLAAHTIDKYACALAKLLRVHSWEIHDNKPRRDYRKYTRSRGYSEARFEQDRSKYSSKYGPIIDLMRCTGVRRETFETLYPESFVEGPGGKLYLPVDGKKIKTKGGRPGLIEIIDENQVKLRELLALFPKGQLICPKVPNQIDEHGIRSLYAEDFYFAIARPIDSIPLNERIPLKNPKFDNRPGRKPRTSVPGIYHRKDGRLFDRKALLRISKSLIHERDDVVAQNYLWRSEPLRKR